MPFGAVSMAVGGPGFPILTVHFLANVDASTQASDEPPTKADQHRQPRLRSFGSAAATPRFENDLGQVLR